MTLHFFQGFIAGPLDVKVEFKGGPETKIGFSFGPYFIYLRLSNYKYADIALLFRRFTLTSVSFVSPVIPVNPKQQYCGCSHSGGGLMSECVFF